MFIQKDRHHLQISGSQPLCCWKNFTVDKFQNLRLNCLASTADINHLQGLSSIKTLQCSHCDFIALMIEEFKLNFWSITFNFSFKAKLLWIFLFAVTYIYLKMILFRNLAASTSSVKNTFKSRCLFTLIPQVENIFTWIILWSCLYDIYSRNTSYSFGF